MSNVNAYTRIALGNVKDLTTPASAAAYPVGGVVEVTTNTGIVKKYKYVKSHGALTAYQPYVIAPDATYGWLTAAPTTSTTVINEVCVPQVAFTSGYYGFVEIEGAATAKLPAATHTIGDTLELLSGGSTFVLNSATSGTAVFDASVVAICNSVSTGAESAGVMLVGRQASIAAS